LNGEYFERVPTLIQRVKSAILITSAVTSSKTVRLHLTLYIAVISRVNADTYYHIRLEGKYNIKKQVESFAELIY